MTPAPPSSPDPYVLSDDRLVAMHANNERIYADAPRQDMELIYRMFGSSGSQPSLNRYGRSRVVDVGPSIPR